MYHRRLLSWHTLLGFILRVVFCYRSIREFFRKFINFQLIYYNFYFLVNCNELFEIIIYTRQTQMWPQGYRGHASKYLDLKFGKQNKDSKFGPRHFVFWSDSLLVASPGSLKETIMWPRRFERLERSTEQKFCREVSSSFLGPQNLFSSFFKAYLWYFKF